MEKSLEESQAMTHLEGELTSTLLFEHGGSHLGNTLCVVHILLGRLFCERLALGLMVEAFAKHY